MEKGLKKLTCADWKAVTVSVDIELRTIYVWHLFYHLCA